MSKTIEELEAFAEEQKKYFSENIFSRVHAIMETILCSKYLRGDFERNRGYFGKNHYINDTCDFKMNGLKFIFSYVMNRDNVEPTIERYTLRIRHMFSDVLIVRYYNSVNNVRVDVEEFNEGNWINSLIGIVERLKVIEVDVCADDILGRFGKYK